MNQSELIRTLEKAHDVIKAEFGEISALGIVPGTGWDRGVASAMTERQSIPYEKLGIPDSGQRVEGHHKALRLGEIEGRDVLAIGRIHANENATHPDLRQSMALIIGALRLRLDGLLVTNGVGTLHGAVGLKKGRIHSVVRTAILDALGWAHRGRPKEPVNVGDVAIVEDVKTSLIGAFTPLGAGQFVDFYHNGIHRDNDQYFELARGIVAEIQGRCPRSTLRFIAGPQFEGPADKIQFRAQGDDIIGMSGLPEALACTAFGIPFAHLALATNGPFGQHSHEGNQDIGKKNAEKCDRILRVLAQRWPRR